MQQPVLTLAFFEKGKALPHGFQRIIDEAGQAMAGLIDAQGKPYSPGESGLDGTMDLIFLLCDREIAGVMSFEVKEDDAQLFYCHVREADKAYEGQFFTMAVGHFRSSGMGVVRTYFYWPSPEPCITAAGDMGFMPLERIEMARESDRGYPVRPLPEDVELVPWSDGYLDDAARLLSENGNEIDRKIYPQEQTFAGARAQLKKITGNMYGNFLPDQSMIARAGGATIGMLLATERDGPSILIPQVILDRNHRGRGIASAMIGRLVRDVAKRGDRKMTLMVNGQNSDAIRLYGRKGFRPLFVYKQYVLSVEKRKGQV
ncbi:MAG TPA: GNAT family N-acetyltransferase [Methanocella sp.]|jgi:ribosomal protein S18 acetylase RimI-like enzyme